MLSESSFRAQLVIHEQRELYDYWRERAGKRPMPARLDINPCEIIRLLPLISIVELSHGPAQAWFRLAGTKLRDIYGLEVTGKRVAEVAAGPQTAFWHDVYAKLADTGRPLHGAIRGPIEGREHILMFWLRLPLSEGAKVDRVLCFDYAMPAVGQFGESSACLVPPSAGTPLRRAAQRLAKACA